MKPELEQIYTETLENETRSKLEPFGELILRWRRQGKSYRCMIRLLAYKCALQTSKTALIRFVKKHSRPRKRRPDIDIEAELPAVPAVSTCLAAAGPFRKLTTEERAAQVEFIRSLNKPEVLVEKPKQLFDPDLSKPRTRIKQ